MAKLQTGPVIPGSCFMAIEQTAGRGQRGRSWSARKGENITMSLCLPPTHPEYPFLFSAAVALGCYDFIKARGINQVAIKWPNDIYIGDRKAAGILIDTVYRGYEWEWAVVGAGVNVNQAEFGDLAARATSLRLETETSFDIIALGKTLRENIQSRQTWAAQADAATIMAAYNDQLYARDKSARVRQGAAVFDITISHVESTGDLLAKGNLDRRFAVGDLDFLSFT